MKDLVNNKAQKAAKKVTTPKVLKANRYVGVTLRGALLRAYWVATLNVTGQVAINKDSIKATAKKPTEAQAKLAKKLLDVTRNHAPKGNVSKQGAITAKGIEYINNDMAYDMDKVKEFIKSIKASKAGTDYIQVQA